MKHCLICVFLAGVVQAGAQLTVSNNPVADTFVRANDPTHNFGGAGALEVSGSTATNAAGATQGAFDSFLRFDLSSSVTALDLNFGAGNWTLSSATLKVTEVGAPMNTIFNRGTGQFSINWIANDSWAEGTGMPNAPTTDGIVWNDVPGVLSAGQASLGTFTNASADGLRTFSLSLPASFVNDIAAGGLVSFYLTATTDKLGFNFNSRNFTTASARPSLELTAVAIPEPSTICLLTFSVAALAVARRRRSH